MTKEEFINIVNDEINRLNEEKEKYNSDLSKAKRDMKWESAQIELMLDERRLHSLIALPAFARIQAMSEAEIAQYKNEELPEIDREIADLEKDLLVLKEEFLDPSKRNNLLFGRIEELENLIAEKNATKEKIMNGQPDDIKKYFSEKYGVNDYLADKYKALLNGQSMSNYQEFLGNMVKDPSSLQPYDIGLKAALLEQYSWAVRDFKNPHINRSLSVSYLPKKLERDLEAYGLLNSRNLDFETIEKAEKVFDNFMLTFDEARMAYENKFSPTNVDTFKRLKEFDREIIQESNHHSEVMEQIREGYYNARYSMPAYEQLRKAEEAEMQRHEESRRNLATNIKLSDLDYFKDQLDATQLDDLKRKVKRLNELNTASFKDRKVENEINDLSEGILNNYQKNVHNISKFFSRGNKDILNLEDGYPYNTNLEEIKEKGTKEIAYRKQQLLGFKNMLSNYRMEIENGKAVAKDFIDQLLPEIKQLSEKKDIAADEIEADSYYKNFAGIVQSYNKLQTNELVNKIKVEAQNQADIKEAEIRGIPLEELLAMRDNTLNDEEMSHGMKR